MNTLFTLIANNLRILFRTRATALTLLLAPLALLFIAGLAFSSASSAHIRVGTFSGGSTPVTDSVLAALHDKGFRITSFSSEQSCADSVRFGTSDACASFPAGLAVGGTITLFVDPSRQTLISTVLDSVESPILARSSEYSRNLTQSIADALATVKGITGQRKDAFVTLTTQISQAGQGTNQVAGSFSVPNGSLDLNQLGVPDVALQSALVNQQLDAFANTTDAAAHSIQSQLDDIDSSVSSSNLSNATKQSIHADVLNASDSADAIISASDPSHLSTALTSLTTSLNSLIAKLSASKSALDQINSARASATSDLQTMKTRLDGALLTVADLQKAFNDISAAVNGVSVSDAGAVSAPIRSTVVPVSGDHAYLGFAFPLLMLLVLLFSGLVLPSVLVLSERHSPAAFRTFLLPIKDTTLLAGTVLSCIAVLAAQSVLFCIVAAILFKMTFGIPLLLAGLLLASTTFVLCGTLLSCLISREFIAVLVSLLVGVGLFLLSDFIIPLAVLPPWLSFVTWNPVALGGDAFRISILFSGALQSALIDLAGLAAWSVALTILVLALYRSSMRLTLERFASNVMGKKK
jgi:ABC-type multidrug transport system permease subunit